MAEPDYAEVNAIPLRELTRYADALRRASRGRKEPLPDAHWMDLYDRGLRAGIESHDTFGVATLVGVLVNRFDGGGRIEDAISYLRQALSLAANDRTASALLFSMLAKMQTAHGNLREARQSLAAAAPLLRDGTVPRVWDEFRSSVIFLNCAELRSSHSSMALKAVGEMSHRASDALASLSVSWLVPYLVAVGQTRLARPWAHWLKVTSAINQHPWRSADAAMFEWSIGAHHPGDDSEAPNIAELSQPNWIARWRMTSHQVHSALVRGDFATAFARIDILDADRGGAYAPYRSLPEVLRALAGAYQGGSPPIPKQPAVVSLFNLPMILASMELVAISASQVEARQWATWCAGQLPPHVETAIDWPVSRRRVEGLLRLRAGDTADGIRLLRHAITWADEVGCAAEQGLARVQLAEVLAHSAQPESARAGTQDIRQLGWSTLRSHGIEPLPQAYYATRAARLDETDAATRLTDRELSVLRLLEEGFSYREIGSRLGTSWRTAQSHAYHIYAKLEVDRRIHAIARARELGILPSPVGRR